MVYMSSSIQADYDIKKIMLLKLGLGLVNLMLKLNHLTSFINYLANQHLVTLGMECTTIGFLLDKKLSL